MPTPSSRARAASTLEPVRPALRTTMSHAGTASRSRACLMGNAVGVDRLHFAFTITFHYIFPQLTMGLSLLLLILKTPALRTGNESNNRAVHCWTPIFAINSA